MEQYVKGFKGFTPVKMCGLSPLASFYFFILKKKKIDPPCLLSSNGEGLGPGFQNMEACFLLVNFRERNASLS